jgi:uncharacterized protein (UPF0261 family)
VAVAQGADGICRVTATNTRPRVLLIGTFDTKGDEYAYVREHVLSHGCDVLTMDLGVFGDATSIGFPVDVAADEVARAGGTALHDVRTRRDRGTAVDVMTKGARALVARLHSAGRFDGVLGLGGGGGTTMITAAMRELPVGVPKVMVSTMASGNTAPYVDVKDLTMMYSVVDIAGLNPISRRILDNAAGAICGMLRHPEPLTSHPERSEGSAGVRGKLREGSGVVELQTPRFARGDKGAIAATMFGVTTPCVTAARKRLEAEGYDVVVFHATGAGGRAMEGLIDDGYFVGVLDVTTTEWCDEVVGGVLSAGPERLGAAARKGIPQVVSVGALDMVNFGPIDTVPERFRKRNLYRHNETVTLMRTTTDECREIGSRIGGKLMSATGPVTLMLPTRGVSMLDESGKPFYNAEADRALFDSLRRHSGSRVRIVEMDAHINDEAFARSMADELITMLRAQPTST